MANNPFDPHVVQIKRTLERGGLSGANKGFGSVRSQAKTSRPSPGVSRLQQLADVDGNTTHLEGQGMYFDAAYGKWVPGTVSLNVSPLVQSILEATTAEEILALLGFDAAVEALIAVHAAATDTHGMVDSSTVESDIDALEAFHP